MWLVRALARLVVQIVVISAVTVLLALLLATVSAGSFHSDGRVLGLVFGCMLLAMGGVGRGSNIERFSDQGVMQQVWGTIPGFDALQSHPDEPRLNPGIALFLSGLVLVALALTVL
jgi:xanthine/uracil permease